jgi:hypothetical protein
MNTVCLKGFSMRHGPTDKAASGKPLEEMDYVFCKLESWISLRG